MAEQYVSPGVQASQRALMALMSDTAHDRWFTPPSRRVQWTGTSATFALYALVFFALDPLLGAAVTALSVMPVLVAGWLLGVRAGLLSGVLCFGFNLLLLAATGQPGLDVLVRTPGGAMGSALLPVFGVLAGLIGTLLHQVGRELSARRQAETSLRESEAKYRNLIERANDGVAIVQDETVKFVNAPLAAMWGGDAASLIGARFAGHMHPDERERWTGYYRRCVAGEPVAPAYETRFSGADGRTTVVELNAGVIPYQGRPAVLLFIRDISERKQAEEQVRQMALMLDMAPNAITVHDFDGRFLYANQRNMDLHGFARDEFMALSLHQIDAPASEHEISARMAQLRERGEGTFDVTHYRKDGSLLPLEVSARIAAWNGASAILSVATDLTERKRADEALRESETRYRLLFEHNPQPMWVYDLETLRFLAVNDFAIRKYGYSREEFLQMTIRQIRPVEHVPRFERYIADTADSQIKTSGPWQHQLKDGTVIDVEVASHTVRLGDRPARLVLALDITARRQAEEAVRRRLAELEVLHTTSVALRKAQSVDDALPILLDETLAALESDAGAIWLHDADRGELRPVVARGWLRDLPKIALRPGDGIVGTVFASGQTYRTPEFRSDPLASGAPCAQAPAGQGGACLPIRTGALTAGVLLVSMPRDRLIGAEQVQLLESLAEMGGAALHRMRLHAETVHHLEQVQALHSIDLAITTSTDLRITFGVLLEHVTTQLQADCADVLLLDPYTQTLEFAGGRGFRTRHAHGARMRVGEDWAGLAVRERRMVHTASADGAPASPHFAALWHLEGLASYYAVPLIAKGQVKGVLEVFHRAPLAAGPDWIGFLETLAGQAAIAIDNAQLFENLQRSNLNLSHAYDATIEGWSRALDLRDRETEGHTQRVTALTLRLARAMGLSDGELTHMRRGALLHDIGKMGVPDSILFKAGPLSASEVELMRKHPAHAYEMLAPIDYLQPALDIPYCHHEKWDGTGYPRGLKGERIPLAARIFAVADVFDALRSDRPYRKAWPEAEVIAYIRAQAGQHFDPRVVDVFMAEQAVR